MVALCDPARCFEGARPQPRRNAPQMLAALAAEVRVVDQRNDFPQPVLPGRLGAGTRRGFRRSGGDWEVTESPSANGLLVLLGGYYPASFGPESYVGPEPDRGMGHWEREENFPDAQRISL